MREPMRVLTALVLIACAIGAINHFWPERDSQPVASAAPEQRSDRSALPAPSDTLLETVPRPASAPAQARAPRSIASKPPSPAAARIVLHAAETVRHGDKVSVTIDMQALRAMRQLEFSVTYDKSILRLLDASPGAFAQQQGTSVHFEEPSDGSLIVRIEVGSGAIAGAGSVAVLEFQALQRGESPLVVEDVTYVEHGSYAMANTPQLYERSITVD